MLRWTEQREASLRGAMEALGGGVLSEQIRERLDGGPGSGNWGHAGRKGVRGGSAGGGGTQHRMKTEKGGYTSTKRFANCKSGKFAKAVAGAKAKVDERKAWRVDAHSKQELDEYYPDAKLHVTKGGSTIAVNHGDIISVCRAKGDDLRGGDLLKLAVKHGGEKLDSYAGNHKFYAEHGFEPVSWCEWNDEFAPPGWDPKKDNREPIIFYQYTGKGTTESAQDFMKRVKASKDYDTAHDVREEALKQRKLQAQESGE